MKLFLWTSPDNYTHAYQGLAIVAVNLDHARVQWRERALKFNDLAPVRTELPNPDRTYQIDPYSKEEVHIFPSGCCE